jgi:voltage-gated potassium channel
MTPAWPRWLGLAGVGAHERAAARHWHRRFEWVLIPLAIWLPAQWLLESRGERSANLVMLVDWAVWALFVAETLTLSLLVHDRSTYLRGNWLNLAIIVLGFPLIWHGTPWIAVARMLRLLVVLSVALRVWGLLRGLLGRNQLGPIILVMIVATTLAGLLVAAIDPAFKSAADGIWWAWVTVTTVGYGDFAPLSLGGRLIAIVLMLGGVGFIALMSATLAEYFLEDEEREARRLRKEILKRVHEQMTELERAAQDREEILRRLDALSAQLNDMRRELRRER